ncbi:MAG: hypothetical protein R2879_12950 [Saprospiraceae bacterium]
MDPILDAEPRIIERGTLFSKLAFIASMAGFFSLFLVYRGAQNVLNQVMSFVDFRILIMVFLFFSLLGFSFSVISILKREKNWWMKTAGVFLNIFLLFLIIGFMIFGNIGWY